MASSYSSRDHHRVLVLIFTLTLIHVVLSTDNPESTGPRVSFNNPKLLGDIDKEGYDGYTVLKQETMDPQKLGGVIIQDEAKRLADKITALARDELAAPKMQSIYDKLTYENVQPNYEKQLKEVASDIEAKLDLYLTVLRTNKIMVEKLYSNHLQKPIESSLDCCSMPKSQLKFEPQYHCSVSRDTTCDLLPQNLPPRAFNPGRNLTEVFQHIAIASVKWQYFMSSDGIHNEFPAHDFGADLPYSTCKDRVDLRHRMAYISTVHPQRKNIVILMDHANSLSTSQLSTAKAVVQYLLSILNDEDRVAILGVSGEVTTPRDHGCLSSGLSPVTFEAKLYLGQFVEGLSKQETAANHSLAFRHAFSILADTLKPDGKPTGKQEAAMIVYVSRGLLSVLTEAKDVLKTIAEENGRLENRVVITTYPVVDDGKPIMYEKTFLQDVANQDFAKYELKPQFDTPPPRGHMVTINSPHDLSVTVANFSDIFNFSSSSPASSSSDSASSSPAPSKPRLSSPIRDEMGGISMSLTYPCVYEPREGQGQGSKVIGVVGLDIHLGALMEEVTYFSGQTTMDGGGGGGVAGAYAFVVDRKGNTIMHPALERPIKTNVQPMNTDIAHFEKYKTFDTIKKQILRQKNSSATFKVQAGEDGMLDNQVITEMLQGRLLTITYRWKRLTVKQLESSPLIVVIKIVEDRYRTQELGDLTASQQQTLVYHRLDLLPTDHTCMHLKQFATKESSALFLSASAFNKPFEHLSQEEKKRQVQIFLAYLNDNTGLLSNPGLKKRIRSDVSATRRITNDWLMRMKYMSHIDNQHVVRRYVATSRGVMQMYPGTLMHRAYAPERRPWYQRALQFPPGTAVLSAPYLDAGGAGFIITLSTAITQKPRNSSEHSPSDRIEAVMGLDLPLGYFYKLLILQMPVCEKHNIRCFIMDHQGYLIAHQGLIEANGKGPQEQEHLTRKEPLVANDILHHDGFVEKRLCNSYNDRTIQRYYQFNASTRGVLTNKIHGEQLSHYEVTPIPGTNAFVGIVNETYNMMFCPCSMVDRLCLNCNRMEQTECECPCECPLAIDFCSGELVDSEDSNPSCPPPAEPVLRVDIEEEVRKSLDQCFMSSCHKLQTQQECLGVVDCEWCALDSDGVQVLERAFCGTQRMCFAGVLGAPTPYDDSLPVHGEHLGVTAITELRTTPVGPVAGGIMAAFLVLALGVYCYRHHAHRTSPHYGAGGSTGSEGNGLRGAAGDDDDICDIDELDDSSPDEMRAGLTNLVLATFDDPVASVSPYRMNTTYRGPGRHHGNHAAPHNGADSDLGYSTMTPTTMTDSHSERGGGTSRASSSIVEPLLIGRNRYRPPSSASVVKPSPTTPMLPPPPAPTSRKSRSRTPSPMTRLPPEGGGDMPVKGGVLLEDGQTVLPSQTVLPTDSPHRVIASVQVHMVDSH